MNLLSCSIDFLINNEQTLTLRLSRAQKEGDRDLMRRTVRDLEAIERERLRAEQWERRRELGLMGE